MGPGEKPTPKETAEKVKTTEKVKTSIDKLRESLYRDALLALKTIKTIGKRTNQENVVDKKEGTIQLDNSSFIKFYEGHGDISSMKGYGSITTIEAGTVAIKIYENTAPLDMTSFNISNNRGPTLNIQFIGGLDGYFIINSKKASEEQVKEVLTIIKNNISQYKEFIKEEEKSEDSKSIDRLIEAVNY